MAISVMEFQVRGDKIISKCNDDRLSKFDSF